MIGIKINSRGFTLIELIVVMAVFLFIIGGAVGIFLSVLQNQKRILAEQQILNQISYAEEYMSKALRMAREETNGNCHEPGYIYSLTRPDRESGFYRGIKFINQSDNDACQEFFLDEDGVLKELKNSTDDSNAVALTSSDFEITSVRFGINGLDGCYGTEELCPPGASSEDSAQPRVTILLNIGTPTISIQTTVSQRNLNAK